MVQSLGCFGAILGEELVTKLANNMNIYSIFLYSSIFGLFLTCFSYFFMIFIKKRENLFNKTKFQKNIGIKSAIFFIKKKEILLVALYAFCTWTPVTIFAVLWGLPFLKKLYNISSQESAYMMSIIWISIGIFSPLVGCISNYMLNRKIPMALSMLCGIFSSIMLIYFKNNNSSLILYLILFGIGPAGQILSFSYLQDICDKEYLGRASGFNNMSVIMGGIILQPFIGIFLKFISHNKPISINNYRVSLICIPICFIVGFITTFFLKETYCKKIRV